MWPRILGVIRSPNTWAQNAHWLFGYAVTITPWAIWRSEKGVYIAAVLFMCLWAIPKEILFDWLVEHPGPNSRPDWEDLGFYVLGVAVAVATTLYSGSL